MPVSRPITDDVSRDFSTVFGQDFIAAQAHWGKPLLNGSAMNLLQNSVVSCEVFWSMLAARIQLGLAGQP